MKEKIEKLRVIHAMGWLQNAVEVARKEPAVIYEKYPSLSVDADAAVAVKCLDEPRLKTSKDGRELAFVNMELVEPATVWERKEGEKEGAPHEASKGTKVTMNLKRHASLWRAFQKFLPSTNKELVIINLGKRTFKTDKAPRGKATGYDYRIYSLAEFKEKMRKNK